MRKFIVVVLLCVIMALGFFATVEAVGGKLTMDTIDRAENVCSLGDCLYCGGAGEPQTGYWICIQSLRRFQDFWSKLPWVPDYYNYDMTIMLVDRDIVPEPVLYAQVPSEAVIGGYIMPVPRDGFFTGHFLRLNGMTISSQGIRIRRGYRTSYVGIQSYDWCGNMQWLIRPDCRRYPVYMLSINYEDPALDGAVLSDGGYWYCVGVDAGDNTFEHLRGINEMDWSGTEPDPLDLGDRVDRHDNLPGIARNASQGAF
jgi:hypothetical protein